jgi:hypothetical protein
MSNQAHKNRLARTMVEYEPKDSKIPAHRYRNFTTDYKTKKRQALGKARGMELDPSKNPSGRAKYGIEGMRYNIARQDVRGSPSPLPDPSASSRGANVRANKERGTQSSTQRKVIK